MDIKHDYTQEFNLSSSFYPHDHFNKCLLSSSFYQHDHFNKCLKACWFGRLYFLGNYLLSEPMHMYFILPAFICFQIQNDESNMFRLPKKVNMFQTKTLFRSGVSVCSLYNYQFWYYSVLPVYHGRVYRGIGYIVVACWTPFFGHPFR